MLYVTTRSKLDAYTAFRTLEQNRGPDGGLFVPFRLPHLDAAQIEGLRDKSFGQCVAEALNLFFSARIDGWDVDFSIGRNPAKLVPVSHRIIIAETWHNPDWNFGRMVRNLSSTIRGSDDKRGCPSNWAWTAVRIAALFGLCGELERLGAVDLNHPVDLAVPAGDFSAPMSAWYAREMGLPIQNILCACNENSAAWDLLHHGQMRTNAVAVPTSTPEADVGLPSDLERLIFETLGLEETLRYCQACRKGEMYAPGEKLETLRDGIYAAVIGQARLDSIINSVYRSGTYLLGPYSALAYGGLQDYRAVTGESRTVLLLAEQSPACAKETVAKAMGITVHQLKEMTDIG